MATVVKATAFGGAEVLAVVDEPVPAPGPGEVTIRVEAAAVNPRLRGRRSRRGKVVLVGG